MTQQHRLAGLAMLGACLIWGLSPVYFKALSAVPPGELVAHRAVWSLILFLVILTLRGELGTLLAALRGPHLPRIMAAALTVSLNWLIFVLAVFSDHVVQASLGYYIFPLFSVSIGVVVFGERLGRMRAIAVGLAVVAVLVLSVGLGVAPWLSLAIAGTFAIYAAIKKGIDLPPLVSVAAELCILAVPAILWLVLRPESGPEGAPPLMGTGMVPALLMFSSIMTALPLLLFSYAARRLDLATIGLMQYLSPTMQFAVATLWFHEPFTSWHIAAFVLIWLALGLYSAAGLQRRRSLPGAPPGL